MVAQSNLPLSWPNIKIALPAFDEDFIQEGLGKEKYVIKYFQGRFRNVQVLFSFEKLLGRMSHF